MKGITSRVSLFFKGVAMGAADVVPGVSGGTIAFITGIYEELILSIKSVNGVAVKKLFKEGAGSFWRHINGTFLLVLISGILVSIASLARGITYLLQNYPILVWAFFFGLIVGSVWYVARRMQSWTLTAIIMGAIGAGVAYFITVTVPAETTDALWYVFVSGFIAICAMILPGISGSFILLLLGQYEYILTSVKEFKLSVIITFAVGCVAGLLSFSHLIAWLFKKYHDATIALLAGFMLGSLNKVWPWKEVLSTRPNNKGEIVPFMERSVMPQVFEAQTGNDPQLFGAIMMALAGIAIVLAFEFISTRKGEDIPIE